MAKKVSGFALVFLGAFLLVSAVLFVTVGAGLSQRTPLNVDSNTFLTGQAKKLNPLTGKVDDVPVKVLSKTQVDPKRSDDKVVVFVNYNCVNIDRDNPPDCLESTDDRLIVNSDDVFAADRHTGVAVNDAKYVGSDATQHAGLLNKFPFNTQKKSYQIYDGLLGKSVPLKYAETTSLDGLKVYKFNESVPATDAKIAGEVEGTYQTDKQIWVEPATGSIVNQTQHEVRLLPDGSTVLDMSLKFTPKTVSAAVKDGKANSSKLHLLSGTLPIVLGLLGLLALVGGLVLLRRGRSAGRA